MNSRRQISRRERTAEAPQNRTLVVVVLASLGAGLMAFVLGINVGLERTPAEAAATDSNVLRTLDSQATRLREVRARERTELSFHDSLTGPARVAKAHPAPATTPVTVAAPTPPGTPEHAVAVAEASETQVAAAAQDTARDAVDLGQAPAAEADSAQNTEEAAPALEVSHFSLQVGAFPDETSASTLRRRLQSKGYQVRIATSDIEGRGTWYRVRVGRFEDRATAEDQRTKISSSEGLFALVVPET
ncbi:MAG: SPOR domain-containing protein [Pseudomonadota bacterium]